MSNYTYSRLGVVQMGEVKVGDVSLDSRSIESKLDKIYTAIADNQITVEVPQPTADVYVEPVIVAEMDWAPLAEILTHTKAPIINVQPPEIAVSLSPSPVVVRGDPALVWGVYAIAFILACIFTLISCAFYYYSFA